MSGIIGMNSWEKERAIPRFRMRLNTLRGPSRKASIVRERVRAAEELRDQDFTIEEIGDILNRDHSTIVHYLRHYQK